MSRQVATEVMEVIIYVNRLKWLFVEGHGRTEGYTAYCIELLKRSRVCILKGMACSIGGPNAITDELFERCLDRMKTWVRMAAEVAQAEDLPFKGPSKRYSYLLWVRIPATV